MYDDATGTGAVIVGNIITLHFVDGQRGDSDLVADGVIVDPGGPGEFEDTPAGTSDGGKDAGICFIGSLTQ